MRVLICGPRDWHKPIPIDVLVGGFAAVYGDYAVTVIHGGAKGVDTLAASAAIRHGCATDPYPADWKRHGRGAGPRRNQQMLDEGKPDLVVAVTDDVNGSRGTADMVRRAHKAGIPVWTLGRVT